MKVVITGANGTVGSALRAFLESQEVEVVPWDRGKVSIRDPRAMESFLKSVKPDMVYHLAVASRNTDVPNEGWLVNCEWPGHLARITKALGVKLIHISTVMVFSDAAKGPFTSVSIPDASQGYGFEKRKAEEMVSGENPGATIVRLGWQVGETAGSNNMIDNLESQMRQHGHIRASMKWLPACSFLLDTVQTLFQVSRLDPGLYMIDSNERWNFFQIVCALNEARGGHWSVVPTNDFVYDQRMLDPRIQVHTLKKRLEKLV